jgi:hypothetical protein
MATYSVVAQDGNSYGPADESTMAEWIRQGRVNRDTVLHCHQTNARIPAWTVPSLQPVLGLSPEQVNQLLHGATAHAPPATPPAPAPYAPAQGQYPPPPHPGAPLGYAGPQTYGGPAQVNLSSFPVVGAVFLSIFVPFFAPIYYGLVHGNLPKRRPDDPGAGKAIGFMFIPFFNIYWVCFFWVRLCTRINDERLRIGLPPTAPRGLVIAILCCYLGMFIPILNILVAIAIIVMLLIAIIQLQGSINGLADAAGQRR